ncbi:fungal-specific transcription factor domain-containing protein [Mycena amicta]|nr:fungal-specific transcription factor domain-containing protein [Mycena amicta]
MSGDEHEQPTKVKVRRPERSCDSCRRKKVRCDGQKKANNNCSNCAYFRSECTYVEKAKKRGPKSKLLEDLKRQNTLLEAKLRALSVCSLCAQPLPKAPYGGESSASVFQQSPSNTNSPPSDEDEVDDLIGFDLSAQFNRVSIDSKYFGAASNFALASSAIVAKERITGRPTVRHRRAEVWDVLPWERDAYELQTNYVYPDSDLISSLLLLYFENVHPTLPVLHRSSFERSVAENLHLVDPQFGATLLVVLAVASRYSDDPRVFVDGRSTLSSGWKFIKQIPVVRKWFEPNLYEVQFYLLMSFYCIGTSRPQGCWTYLGLGTRFLQQRGEHRNRREQRTTHELELWNRVFWTYFCFDRSVCAFIGRPTGLHLEDVDADLPLEVDDEYWDDNFVQPPNKPAFHAFLTYYVQLSEILGSAMRRLYGSKRSKALQGWDGRDWEQRIVADLDSKMNECFDSFPPHLRWDPDRTSPVAFFDQSFVLHVTGLYTRIVIHRPYINKMSVSAAPSLLICTSAARAVLHATESWVKIRRTLLPQTVVSPLFVATIVLIMATFSSKTAGAPLERDKTLVKSGMDLLKACTVRRQSEGRLWEMLYQLQSDDSPLSRRDGDAPQDTDTAHRDPLNVGGCFAAATPFELSVASRLLLPSSSSPSSSASTPAQCNSGQGISIEQMLEETADLTTLPPLNQSANRADDEMMFDLSMWNSVPTDISDISQWGAYVQKHTNWSFNF